MSDVRKHLSLTVLHVHADITTSCLYTSHHVSPINFSLQSMKKKKKSAIFLLVVGASHIIEYYNRLRLNHRYIIMCVDKNYIFII